MGQQGRNIFRRWKKGFILLGMVTAVFWFFEKTRPIPEYGRLFYEKGVACEGRCPLPRQLKYFQKAVSARYRPTQAIHNSWISDAYYRSSLIYEKSGDRTRQLAALQKAMEYDKEHMMAYYKIGVYYFEEEDFERALRYFLMCIRRINYPVEAQYYVARLYDAKKEYKIAIPNYFTILQERPEFAEDVYPRLAAMLREDEEIVRDTIHLYRAVSQEDKARELESIFEEAIRREIPR